MKYHYNNIDDEFVAYNWADKLGLDWSVALDLLLDSEYSDCLVNFIEQIYTSENEVYPVKNRLFKPFQRCSLKEVKVVIIDNRPVKDIRSSGIGRGIFESSVLIADLPLELRNFRDCIYETIYGNQHSVTNFDNTLYDYTDNGMLFLNTSMCVTKDENYTIIWKNFIRNVIKKINKTKENIVYLFLTGDNDDLLEYIDEDKNKIIKNTTSVLMSYSSVFVETDEYIEETYPPSSLLVW